MKYLQNFTLPSDGEEGNWLYGNNPRTCYDSIYPFNFFSIEKFIISIHSPFILSIPNSRIYNMDLLPVSTCKWSEIPNIRIMFDFFMEHKADFR